jgi:general stress protein YciG
MPKRSAPDPVSEYMAAIGSKGGKATGSRKARSPEHYAKMVAQRISKQAAAARKAKRAK